MKREIFIGSVGIGGQYPVSVQSMTNRPLADVSGTLRQIASLQEAGCAIVRVAIPELGDIANFRSVIQAATLPVIADVQFDARVALAAVDAGCHGLRINPGNIGDNRRLREILRLCGQKQVPIRIGANAGSLEKQWATAGLPRAEALVRSVLERVKFFEDNDFHQIKISLKSSSVRDTVAAYRLADSLCDYPLHLGVTEAGTLLSGSVKSALGIGSLLLAGIGNTVRVSLTADPVQEVRVARLILRSLDLLDQGLDIISCPTCGRTSVDLIAKVEEFEQRASHIYAPKKIKVAIMGCEVNGPGEAKDADIGLAFSHGQGVIFRQGKIVERVALAQAVDRLLELLTQNVS